MWGPAQVVLSNPQNAPESPLEPALAPRAMAAEAAARALGSFCGALRALLHDYGATVTGSHGSSAGAAAAAAAQHGRGGRARRLGRCPGAQA
jgi:hypothetical protein